MLFSCFIFLKTQLINFKFALKNKIVCGLQYPIDLPKSLVSAS